MKLFETTEIFTRNPDFELISEEGSFFFRFKSGHKVQTDAIGQMIWESLPGTASEIQKRVQIKDSVSILFLEEFLFILLRGEIIRFSLEEKQPGSRP